MACGAYRRPAPGPWAIFGAMAVLLLLGIVTVYWAEALGNPAFAPYHVDVAPNALQAGGNMEGKEVRFGIAPSSSFATVTTDAGGAVDAMHDGFMPLGGMVLILNMLLGEIIFGGVGSVLYGMLAFVVVTMFVAGLMVGRTPEYLGKKMEAREVKMTLLALLSYSLSILGWTALAAATPLGIAGIANSGPHGFSEILYAYASTTGTNGSSFAGLSTNTAFYNLTLATAMLMGRFVYAIPLLAVAGSLARKSASHRRLARSRRTACNSWGCRRRADHGRPHLLPGSVARTRRRAGGDESRHSLSGALTGHFVRISVKLGLAIFC